MVEALSYTGKGEIKKRYLIIISDVIGILLNEQATYSNAYKGAITVSGVGMAGTQKDNNNPEEIGKNISAISNSVALLGRNQGYILWGVDNDSKKFIGTNFQPRKVKKGNEELENWLVELLEPKVDFTIYETTVDEKRGVIFEIKPAIGRPTRFSGTEYIRIGSQRRKLQDFPEKERTLWKRLDVKPFENNIALENLTADDVLKLIDYPNYFKKLDERIPENHATVLDRLKSEEIIISKNGSQLYHITNMGAILFCNNLKDFHGFIKKAPRVISYQGTNRIKGIREKQFNRGSVNTSGI